MNELENIIAYRFKDVTFLETALAHPSYVNEKKETSDDNQRLEFLGDAILGTIIAEALYEAFPQSAEGLLSKYKSRLVCEASLAILANKLKLQDYIRMGQGELSSQGNHRPSTLADAFEAMIAAIYLDGGFKAAKTFVLCQFDEMLKDPSGTWLPKDAKTMLQEIVQAKKLTLKYEIVESESDPLTPHFVINALIDNQCFGRGEGRSKKIAEQTAASHALEHFTLARVESP